MSSCGNWLPALTIGFCLRPSMSTDWIRLDCVDHPLQDVVEVDLFGR